jgi:hypothetical protein
VIGSLLLAGLLVGQSDAIHGCRIDHARYVLRADNATTIRFHTFPRSRDWWSELAAEINLETGSVFMVAADVVRQQ